MPAWPPRSRWTALIAGQDVLLRRAGLCGRRIDERALRANCRRRAPPRARRRPPATAQFTMTSSTPMAGSRAGLLQWSPSRARRRTTCASGPAPAATRRRRHAARCQGTSYTLPALPFDRTYYARIFTKQSGAWTLHRDARSSADGSAARARLLAPVDGAARRHVGAGLPLGGRARRRRPTTSRSARAPAGRTSSTRARRTRTWWTVPSLPAGRRLFARVSTKIGGRVVLRTRSSSTRRPSRCSSIPTSRRRTQAPTRRSCGRA